jgi:hypothetical protein
MEASGGARARDWGSWLGVWRAGETAVNGNACQGLASCQMCTDGAKGSIPWQPRWDYCQEDSGHEVAEQLGRVHVRPLIEIIHCLQTTGKALNPKPLDGQSMQQCS